MIIVTSEQRTEVWKRARLGLLTASDFSKVVTWSKKSRQLEQPGGEGKTRADLMWKLVAEKITGQSMRDEFQTFWMKRGAEREPDAREDYCGKYKVAMEQTGLVIADDLNVGCSVDGFIDNRRGVVEIKVPAPWTHLKYLCRGPGDDYKPQVQGQLMVTGAQYAYLYSWGRDFGLPDYCSDRFVRDEVYIAQLRRLLTEFCNEWEIAVSECKQMGCQVLMEAAE